MKSKGIGRFLEAALNVLFGILMLLVFYVTAILDKRANVPVLNTVQQANALYYAVALALLGLLYWMFFSARGGRREAIESAEGRGTRRFYIALGTLFLIVAALQFFVSRWIPVAKGLFRSGDFTSVATCAWDIAHGGSFEGYAYFQTSPNNVNITIVLSWVYRLFNSQWAAVWLGALLVNASVIITSIAVRNTGRSESVALVVAGVGEILAALTWRAFLPYTDNYGMIFIALMLWLYTTTLRPEIKTPLIVLCGACGAFIKVTCLIFLVALGINGLFKWLRDGQRRLNIRRMALAAISVIVILGSMFVLQKPIRERYGYVPGEYPKGWQYMFMVGQNTKGFGVVGGGNGTIRKWAIKKYGNPKEVNQEYLRRAVGFIRERGLTGNAEFYTKKLNMVYNDGYFNNVQSKLLKKLKNTFLYDIYVHEGKYYAYGANLMQILWDAVLLTMMLYCLNLFLTFLRRKRNPGFAPAQVEPTPGRDMANLLKLVVIGVTLYLMLLEGRSKYLYMFLPVFLAAFGEMFQTVGRNLRTARSR